MEKDFEYKAGQIIEFNERTVGGDNPVDVPWRGVLKMGRNDWNNEECLVVYNPNCCKICKDGFGAIATLGEMIGCSMERVKYIGEYADNPELLTEEKTGTIL